MIKQEKRIVNGMDFIYTFSDSGYMIRQTGTGNLYADAYDPEGTNREYQETEEKIPQPEHEPDHTENSNE